VTDDLTQTDFAYLLDLAGIELPAAEVRPLERRRVLDDLGLTWLFPGLVTTPRPATKCGAGSLRTAAMSPMIGRRGKRTPSAS